MECNSLSKSKSKFVELALKVASQSTYGSFRHGAVLVSGGSVISMGFNKPNYTSFAARFRDYAGPASWHAEISAVYNVPRSKLEGATLYVVRIGRDGGLKMSKPCRMCTRALAYCGISKVYYSDTNGKIQMEKIKEIDAHDYYAAVAA